MSTYGYLRNCAFHAQQIRNAIAALGISGKLKFDSGKWGTKVYDDHPESCPFCRYNASPKVEVINEQGWVQMQE